ncbi:MAG: YbhN family protein [Acidimicrobiales bacterium]|jgi:uncharacterized protein (TIRG00374 family)
MARLTKRDLVRFWRPFRIVAGFVLLGVAIWVLTGKSSELAGAGAFLSQLRWEWLVLAAVAEFGSYLSITFMERTLLGAGDVRANLGRLTAIAFSGSAIQSALPVGAAFAGVYEFRQFQLLGADEVLSGWVVIAVGAVAFSTLAALAGIGLAMAATLGSTFDLVYAIVGVLFITLLAMLAWANRGAGYRLALRATTRLEKTLNRPPGQLRRPLGKGLKRMRSVAPTKLEWAKAVLAGTCSWLSDCACLAFAFIAVGADVPWAGLLLAYCGGQLAVNLPITPGGLGVVEGSLTVALVAFGGGEAPTVAAVLLYRLISFWVPLPVGGVCYLGLLRARRQAQRQSALEAPAAPVEGPVPALEGPGPAGDGPVPLTEDGAQGQPRTTKAVAEED